MTFLSKIKNWFKELVFFEALAMIFIILGVVVIIIIIYVADYGSITHHNGAKVKDIEEFGDLLSGLVGSLWALAGNLFFYASLGSQKEEIEQQKELLVQQINEVVNQTKEFRKQTTMAAIQKDETTFFQLLSYHNEILTSITLEISEVDFNDGSSKYRNINGRKSFVEYYDIYKRFFNTQLENIVTGNLTRELIQRVVNNSYAQFYDEYQADLGHYFRNLFNILTFLKSLKDSDQTSFYLRLLLAQLSNFELALVFFHCLITQNSGFKELLEEYAILTTVPDDEIIGLCRKLYQPSAFGKEGEWEDPEDFNMQGGDDGMGGGMYGDDGGFGLDSPFGFGGDSGDEDSNVESDFMKKFSNLTKGLKNESNYSSDSNNEDKTIIEDSNVENSIMSKLSRLKEESKNIDFDYDSPSHSSPEDDILSKLSSMKKAANKEENESGLSANESAESSILSKLGKLKKVSSDNFGYEDILGEINGDNDEVSPPDPNLLSKLSKLKKADNSNLESLEEKGIENSILGKLSKLKSKSVETDFDYEDTHLTKISNNQNEKYDDNNFEDDISEDSDDLDLKSSLLSKLSKLKSNDEIVEIKTEEEVINEEYIDEFGDDFSLSNYQDNDEDILMDSEEINSINSNVLKSDEANNVEDFDDLDLDLDLDSDSLMQQLKSMKKFDIESDLEDNFEQIEEEEEQTIDNLDKFNDSNDVNFDEIETTIQNTTAIENELDLDNFDLNELDNLNNELRDLTGLNKSQNEIEDSNISDSDIENENKAKIEHKIDSSSIKVAQFKKPQGKSENKTSLKALSKLVVDKKKKRE